MADSRIDPTPLRPCPPEVEVDAAELDMARVLGDLSPNADGQFQAPAKKIVLVLTGRYGHGKAAAEWAVARSINSGRCKAVPARVYGTAVFAGTAADLADTSDEPPEAQSPKFARVPEEGPMPFSLFDVIALESLWSRWRDPNGENDLPPSEYGDDDEGRLMFQRDKWIYGRLENGKTKPEVVEELKKIFADKGWELIGTPRGLRDAVNRYAERSGQPKLQGKRGRPRGAKNRK